jgi:DNA-binding phage protein
MTTSPRTGAERYLQDRLSDPEYAAAHEQARRRIDAIDGVLRSLDARRADLGLSKAELARRAGLRPEAVRRLFASQTANPTLATLSAIADALDLELRPVLRNEESAA